MALAVLAVAGLVAHVDVLRWVPPAGLGVATPHPQAHDLFHYYLGSRYFAELGYTGLYEATVVADSEDAAEAFQPEALIRNLESGRIEVPRGDVLARRDSVRARFSEPRWASFKSDVAVFRGWMQPAYWHTSGFLVDHGYNAPPLVTAVLGGLSNAGCVSAGDFEGWLRFADLFLIGLLGLLLTRLDEPTTGLAFLVVAFANPLHDYHFVGGAYLRSGYLIPLVLAALALRKGWLAACGVLIALSGWLRLFPLLLVAVLALQDLLQAERRAHLERRARLYGAFAATSLMLFAATSALVPAPGGRNPWLAFAANTRGHAASEAANRIGVESLVFFSPQKLTAADADSPAQLLARWDERVREVRRQRRGLALVATAALAIAAVAAARRAPPALLPLTWMLLVFALQPLSHYDWVILALVPVAAGPDLLQRQMHLHRLAGVAIATLALAASPLVPASAGELRYALYGAGVLVFLLAACLLAAGPEHPQKTGLAA